MKFKSFARTATLVGAISAVSLLTGCGKVINEGNFGIERYWEGQYNTVPVEQGLKWNIFDSIYEVNGRETLYKIEDAKPKDKDGAILEDLDLSISVRTLKDGAIPFILKTGDIIEKDKIHYVGSKYIQKDAQSVLGNTVQKFISEDILKDKNNFEETFKKDLQTEIDKLYGKAFIVEEVKVSSIKVSRNIEEKIQAVAAVKAEEEKNLAIIKVLKSREEVLTQEANILKRASEKSGIAVDSLLQNELIKAIRDNANIQVTVPVTPKTKP